MNVKYILEVVFFVRTKSLDLPMAVLSYKPSVRMC